MSQVEVDKVIPQSGTTLTIGDSGDTIAIASGATLSGSISGITNLTITGDLTVDTDTLYVDSTNNRVGIGTASPGADLHISSTAPLIRLTDTNDSNVDHLINGSGSALVLSADANNELASSTLRFSVDGSERMRIDSSGNVLVGTTNSAPASNNVTGVVFSPSQASHFSTDGTEPLRINRKTSDGQLISLRKDASEVGSIGTLSGALTIYPTVSIGTGLYMDANHIEPTQNNGTRTDNTRDFGSSSYRWKDLYLGGGLYVGGTGSANKLDDYEEGTWTPSISAVSGFTNSNVDSDYTTYTKVGNLVNVRAHIQFPDSSGNVSTGDYAYIQGLPFAPAVQDNTIMCGYRFNNGSNAIGFVTTATTTNTVRWVCNYVVGSPTRGGGRVSINFFYRTDS